MFDDIKQEPEDIFSQSDKLGPQVQPPIAPSPVVHEEVVYGDSPHGSFVKVALLITAILVVVAGVAFFAYKLLVKTTPSQPPIPLDEPIPEVVVPIEEGVAPLSTIPVTLPPIIETTITETSVDTDKDGLTDDEEAERGTNPQLSDTDADGLFDFEEIKTWKTDVLNADTDGDGFLDGQEVQGGYNPKGEGKLIEAPMISE